MTLESEAMAVTFDLHWHPRTGCSWDMTGHTGFNLDDLQIPLDMVVWLRRDSSYVGNYLPIERPVSFILSSRRRNDGTLPSSSSLNNSHGAKGCGPPSHETNLASDDCSNLYVFSV